MVVIDKFVNRLNRIGIEVTLTANYPWVYLETVNNKKIKEKYMSKYGYTIFFLPIDNKRKVKFIDRRAVFRKIRSML